MQDQQSRFDAERSHTARDGPKQVEEDDDDDEDELPMVNDLLKLEKLQTLVQYVYIFSLSCRPADYADLQFGW